MHIITLGNGTGQATLLRGLRAYACEVTAIVGVTDNGGHSGQLRRLLHLPQLGDTRQCLSALLDAQSVWGQLLRHRFSEGELCGLSVGNFMLAGLTLRWMPCASPLASGSECCQCRMAIPTLARRYRTAAASLGNGRSCSASHVHPLCGCFCSRP